MNALAILLQTLLLLALSPLLSGCIRNWKAKLQNRRGPRVWQPYLGPEVNLVFVLFRLFLHGFKVN